MSERHGVVTAGQMQPADSLLALSPVDLWVNVLAQVETYGMNTSIFLSEILNDPVNPSNFALYLYAMCLSHINKVGSLGGTAKAAVAMNMDDYVLPTGFAKFLEHLGPYTADGASIRTSFNLNTDWTTTSPQFGTAISAHYWDAAATFPAQLQNSPNVFSLYNTNAGSLGEYQAATTSTATTAISGLWGNYAQQISAAIAGAGLSCVLYKDVPKRAPNSSAYANSGTFWNVFDANFNCEEACLFNTYSSLTLTVVQQVVPKVSTVMGVTLRYDAAVSPVPVSCVPHYVNAWLGARQSVYKPGPILSSYKLCQQPVKHLTIQGNEFHYNCISQACYAVLSGFLDQITNVLSSTEVYQLMYLYHWIVVHCVVARVNIGTPIHYQAFSDRPSPGGVATMFAPQAAYVSRDWFAALLPPPLARLVDSIGPVNVDGQLVVPVMTLPGFNWSDASTVWPIYGIGQAPGLLSTTGGQFGDKNIVLTGTVPSLGFAPNNIPVTTAVVQGYYPAGQAHLRMMMWNAQVFYFTSLFDRLHKKAFSGASISSSLIHMHNPPCGSVTSTLVKARVEPGTNQINVPPLSNGASFVGVTTILSALTVYSPVNLSADELTESIMFLFLTSPSNANEGISKFYFRVPSTAATLELIQGYTQRTFSPESTFSKSLSIRQAEFNEVITSAGGVDVIDDEMIHGCWIRKALKTVGREVLNSARFVVPTAAGLICSTLAENPVAGLACEQGAAKVMKTISSYMGIEADGHNTATQEEIAEVKKKLDLAPHRNPNPISELNEVKVDHLDARSVNVHRRANRRAAQAAKTRNASRSRSRSRGRAPHGKRSASNSKSRSRSRSKPRVVVNAPKRNRRRNKRRNA